MAEVPTFKLVLVGDGGTGALFLSVFITTCVYVCVCVSFMYTYLCARFVRKFGTDHHDDDVVGSFFFIQERNETKSSRDQRVVQLKQARCFFRFVIS